MVELKKTKEVEDLIAICKSNSGISGPVLAKAHITLGELLGAEMNFPPEDTTVVAILRGGIFFAQGIYFALDCSFALYDPKQPHIPLPKTKNLIFVDSVIHKGKTLEQIFKEHPPEEQEYFVASCVTHQGAVPMFGDKLYTIRVSENSFQGTEIQKQKGEKGPDTTLRLFHQI